MILSVSILTDYIKALSTTLLSKNIKIYVENNKDLVCELIIDNVFTLLVFIKLKKNL